MDYLDNPDRFKAIQGFKMESENPNLVWLFGFSFVPHNTDLSNKWTSIYYEIFAKSARKQNLPPMYVSKKTVTTYQRLNQIQSGYSMDSSSDDNILEKMETKARKDRDLDELNPELSKFWRSVDSDIAREKEIGTDDREILLTLHRVRTMQELLRKQESEYLVTGQYM